MHGYAIASVSSGESQDPYGKSECMKPPKRLRRLGRLWRLRMGSMILMVHPGLVDIELENATDNKEDHGKSAQNPGNRDAGGKAGYYKKD